MMDSFGAASKLYSSATAKKRGLWAPVALAVFIGPSAGLARDADAENLRSLAQAERDAGRIVTARVVESYHAIGITSTHARTDSAREWGESFCLHATKQFKWDRPWRLIVYVPQHAQPVHSCRIPTTSDRLNME